MLFRMVLYVSVDVQDIYKIAWQQDVHLLLDM